ncbi:hypothetical protein EV363DRAFT_1417061 [Boletus edulis]|nr:hypothetical protein EV363DRAFT_1417061 [Boletus edulis]
MSSGPASGQWTRLVLCLAYDTWMPPSLAYGLNILAYHGSPETECRRNRNECGWEVDGPDHHDPPDHRTDSKVGAPTENIFLLEFHWHFQNGGDRPANNLSLKVALRWTFGTYGMGSISWTFNIHAKGAGQRPG